MEGIVLGLGLSLHLGFSQDYNPVNPYVEYQHDNLRAGAYYNSEENISVYGGVNLPVYDIFSVDTGLLYGGYPALPNDLLPYVKFNYHYSDSITLFATPGAERQVDDTLQYGIVSGLSLNF